MARFALAILFVIFPYAPASAAQFKVLGHGKPACGYP